MNLLVDTLPTKIKVNNTIYEINYDYKTIINIIMAFEDSELNEREKALIMLKNLYKDDILDEDTEEAIRLAIKFINLGNEKVENNNHTKRVYSFKKDGNYIFTGINSSHHIDIEKESNLHWWKFMTLFMDMDTECFFSELVYYRKRKLEGKLTKEEKKKYKEIKELVELEESDSKITIDKKEARRKFFEELNE